MLMFNRQLVAAIVINMNSDTPLSDVNQGVFNYFIKQKLSWTITGIVVSIIVETAAVLTFIHSLTMGNHNIANISGFAILSPFVVMAVLMQRAYERFQAEFFRQFAAVNSFLFTEYEEMESAPGTIFQLEGNRQALDVITGEYHGASIKLFLYQRTVNHGKSNTYYKNTVFELLVNGRLPQLYLHHKRSTFSNELTDSLDPIANAFTGRQKIALEGSFGELFTLFAQQNTQVLALEVFTPDIMQVILDSHQHLDIEIASDRIYIYTADYINQQTQLLALFSLGNQIHDKLQRLSTTLNTLPD